MIEKIEKIESKVDIVKKAEEAAVLRRVDEAIQYIKDAQEWWKKNRTSPLPREIIWFQKKLKSEKKT